SGSITAASATAGFIGGPACRKRNIRPPHPTSPRSNTPPTTSPINSTGFIPCRARGNGGSRPNKSSSSSKVTRFAMETSAANSAERQRYRQKGAVFGWEAVTCYLQKCTGGVRRVAADGRADDRFLITSNCRNRVHGRARLIPKAGL